MRRATGPTMPAYADMLDDRQVQELAAYLRARFTDKPPWPDINTAVAQSRQGKARQREARQGKPVGEPK